MGLVADKAAATQNWLVPVGLLPVRKTRGRRGLFKDVVPTRMRLKSARDAGHAILDPPQQEFQNVGTRATAFTSS